MNKSEATKALFDGTAKAVHFSHRDTTGNHFVSHTCWLNDDGELVYAHPTDSTQGPIAAPETARYHLGDPGDPEWIQQQADEEQADREARIDQMRTEGTI